MKRRGLLIVFEGIEGAGKSTQIRFLYDRLRSLSGLAREVVLTKEPGGVPQTEHICERLLEGGLTARKELKLFIRDRRIHVCDLIRPKLEEGAIVLCDRFSDSTIAYQHYARDLPLEFVRREDAHARGDIEPNLVIVLDMIPSKALARLAGQKEALSAFDREAEAFHQKVRTGFQKLVFANPSNHVMVNADQPVDLVEAIIWRLILHRALARVA